MEHTTLTFDTISQHSQEFYQQIYVVQTLPKHELINLHEFSTDRAVIVVDSCGWYYQQMFPQHKIHRVEGLTTCKNMKLARDQVDTVFDDRSDLPSFPKINFSNSVLILDHSVLLKYRTPEEIKTILETLTATTLCSDICLRIALLYSNDNRFQNRLNQIVKIVPEGYAVVKFDMNLDVKYQPLVAHFRKNCTHETNIH